MHIYIYIYIFRERDMDDCPTEISYRGGKEIQSRTLLQTLIGHLCDMHWFYLIFPSQLPGKTVRTWKVKEKKQQLDKII